MFQPPSDKMIFGRFIHKRTGLILPNRIVNEGEQAFLRMLMRGDNTYVAGGGNFYVGMTSGAVAQTDTLTEITVNEPTAAGGYSRKAVTRDGTGWPTEGISNNVRYIKSLQIDFTAAGADFDKSITRLFICTAASGTTGTLFAVSAALATPLTVLNASTESFFYELYLRG